MSVMDKYAILLDLQEILVHSGYPRDKIPVRQGKKEVDNQRILIVMKLVLYLRVSAQEQPKEVADW